MRNNEINAILLIVLFIPFLAGVICGLKNKITVFRNYDDLWLAFLVVCAPFVFLFVNSISESQIIFYTCWLLEILLIVYIVQRTFVDNNRHIGATALAIYTKLPLCGFFILQFISYLNDFSKPLYKRSHSVVTLISLILLLPLINRLVKNKNGFLH